MIAPATAESTYAAGHHSMLRGFLVNYEAEVCVNDRTNGRVAGYGVCVNIPRGLVGSVETGCQYGFPNIPSGPTSLRGTHQALHRKCKPDIIASRSATVYHGRWHYIRHYDNGRCLRTVNSAEFKHFFPPTLATRIIFAVAKNTTHCFQASTALSQLPGSLRLSCAQVSDRLLYPFGRDVPTPFQQDAFLVFSIWHPLYTCGSVRADSSFGLDGYSAGAKCARLRRNVS
jgi:hypothetical protein